MFYKKDNNVTTAAAIAAPSQKSIFIGEYLMKATVIVAGFIASKMILQNMTVFTQQGSMSGNYMMLLLGIVMFGCSVRCIVDEFILSPYADKKRQDTLECAKQVRILSNDELVKLFVIESCPEVRGVQLQDRGGVYLRGRYTTHFVEFGQDGAAISSQKHDCRADIEANAIIRCLAKASK